MGMDQMEKAVASSSSCMGSVQAGEGGGTGEASWPARARAAGRMQLAEERTARQAAAHARAAGHATRGRKPLRPLPLQPLQLPPPATPTPSPGTQRPKRA